MKEMKEYFLEDEVVIQTFLTKRVVAESSDTLENELEAKRTDEFLVGLVLTD
jgi:hypothetical protein